MSEGIELVGVSRTFGTDPGVDVLRSVDLRVTPGEVVAVLGPSGSGKSTLLAIAGLLDRPTSGAVLVDGHDTADLDERALARLRARSFGFVFQHHEVLPYLTAGENLAIAARYRGIERRHRLAAIDDALDRVGLVGRGAALGSTMSGGERQRIAIARALLGTPSVVLCDEPTGNLDTANSHHVVDLIIAAASRRVAVVVVTHDHDVAARATRRVEVRDGAILAG